MARNQCNRDQKVKNVQQFIGSFSMDSRAAIQQFLEWFSVDRKLERIVWSWIKRSEVNRAKQSEEFLRDATIIERIHSGDRVSKKERNLVIKNEPINVGPVIGTCIRCSSNIRGMAVGGCGKNAGKFGKLTFYKECSACTYYSEIFKKGNKHIEVEGG